MGPVRVILLITIAMFAFNGCERHETAIPVDEPDSVSEITESATGARLRVEVLDTTIDLTGLISVSVQITWPQGIRVELIEPKWDEAGWTVSTKQSTEVRYTGTEFEQRIQYEIEPFLDGQYEVPSIGIRAESESTGRRIARLQPIGVVVTSILIETDAPELDSSIGFASIPTDTDPQRIHWGFWGGLGLALASGVVILFLRKRPRDLAGQTIDPEAVLAVAATSQHLSDEDLSTLHQALRTLGKKHIGLHSITQEIEQIRFSGAAVDYQRVQSAACRAIESCKNQEVVSA